MEEVSYTVKRLSSGRYYVRARHKDGDTSKGSFATEGEALALMLELRRNAEKLAPPEDAKDRLMEFFILDWLEEKAASREIEPTTVRRLRMMTKNHILPYFAEMKLSEVRREHAADFIKRLNRKLKPGTVNNIRMWANGIFKHAVELELITTSPFTSVKGPKNHNHVQAALCPRPEQVDGLLQYLQANPNWGFAIRLALFTGCRRGELNALIWLDVDFDDKCLNITKSVANAGCGDYVKTCKTTSSNRTIYLTDDLIGELRSELKKLLAKGMSRADAMRMPVILSPAGSKPSVDYFSACVTDVMRKAKMLAPNGEVYTLHDLRHYHATHLLKEGAPAKMVAQRLGHSNVMTTLQIYQSVTKIDDKQLVASTARIGAKSGYLVSP